MSVTVTVLGSAGTHPSATRACSSYLLDADGFRLLLDCGNGSMSNLLKVCNVGDIGAIVLSHLHHDHFADLVGLYYALRFSDGGPLTVPVFAPPGAQAFINQLLTDYDTFGEVCRFTDVRAGDRTTVGPLTLTFFEAKHPVTAHATRVEYDGAIVAYTGDSAPAPGIVSAARDADLFIADATWLERQRPLPAGIHMTGLECGRHATQAEARRLLVTHVYPGNDPREVAAEAALGYEGQIIIAADLEQIEL